MPEWLNICPICHVVFSDVARTDISPANSTEKIEGSFEDQILLQEFCVEEIEIETVSEDPANVDASTQVRNI